MKQMLTFNGSWPSMDYFGDTDPRLMPWHLFFPAIGIDYSTAIRANVQAQNYTVCPRHWYIDVRFRCDDCDSVFLWSAQEQRTWFETYRFYVDSRPKICRDCRAKHRTALELQKEYDALVGSARSGGDAEQKRRIVQIVDELESCLQRLPEKMRETRDIFRKQQGD